MSVADRIQILLSRESPIKASHHYTWHRYGGKPKIISSKKGYKVVLSRGHKFGLRPAKSTPNKVRMVHEHSGLTKVFSLSKNAATRLQNSSRPVK